MPPLVGLQKLAGVGGGEEEVNKRVAASIPVGHVGARWDIAVAAVFLSSPAARFISGVLRGVGACRRAERSCAVAQSGPPHT